MSLFGGMLGCYIAKKEQTWPLKDVIQLVRFQPVEELKKYRSYKEWGFIRYPALNKFRRAVPNENPNLLSTYTNIYYDTGLITHGITGKDRNGSWHHWPIDVENKKIRGLDEPYTGPVKLRMAPDSDEYEVELVVRKKKQKVLKDH